MKFRFFLDQCGFRLTTTFLRRINTSRAITSCLYKATSRQAFPRVDVVNNIRSKIGVDNSSWTSRTGCFYSCRLRKDVWQIYRTGSHWSRKPAMEAVNMSSSAPEMLQYKKCPFLIWGPKKSCKKNWRYGLERPDRKFGCWLKFELMVRFVGWSALSALCSALLWTGWTVDSWCEVDLS